MKQRLKYETTHYVSLRRLASIALTIFVLGLLIGAILAG